MEADYLHLVVNHIPIFSVFFGLLILVWGLTKKNTSTLQIALVFFIFGGISSYAAMETGEKAEDIVEELSIVSHDVIHAHEEAAEVAFWLTLTTALLSIAGFFVISKNIRWQNALFGVLVISALVSLGALLYTAYEGGKIYHSGTEQTAEPISQKTIKNDQAEKINIA